MRLQDTPEYRKKHGKKPAGVLIAFEEPKQINEVLLLDKWRLRIAEQLTREEFERRMMAVKERPDYTVGQTTYQHSRLSLSDAEEKEYPSEEYKYFYTAEVLP